MESRNKQAQQKLTYEAPQLKTYGTVEDLTGQTWTPLHPTPPRPSGGHFSQGQDPVQPFRS